ncbi:MAG: hypothetical protein SGILL_006156 [Bacillariaceae sp.]
MINTVTALTSTDDEDNIPFVQAVYIDGELTEVPPNNIIVDPISVVEEDGSTSAVAVATEVTASSRRSSSFSCTSSHSSRPHQDDQDTTLAGGAASSSSIPERRSVHRVVSAGQDHQEDTIENIDLSPTSTSSDDDDADAQVFGAGAAGAVLGLLVGGPILSVVLGLGAFYHSQQTGAVGDVARAMGDVALLTRTRFEELNEKHHLVDKGKNAAGNALHKIKQAERRRHQRKRAKLQKFLAYCWKSIVAFEEKHHLMKRVSTKAKDHLDALVEQYFSSSDAPNDSDERASTHIEQ